MYKSQEYFCACQNLWKRACACARTWERHSHLNLTSTMARISFLVFCKLQPRSRKYEEKCSIKLSGEESKVHISNDSSLPSLIAVASLLLHVYMGTCMWVWVQEGTGVSICVYERVCVCTIVRGCMCACACAWAHSRAFTCLCVCENVYTYIHT